MIFMVVIYAAQLVISILMQRCFGFLTYSKILVWVFYLDLTLILANME
uniref:Uncharacterized protein n=1 Tax=Rhizophora mucronata TaxID=61149 RepID=A0A2P2IZL5_RHIMU